MKVVRSLTLLALVLAVITACGSSHPAQPALRVFDPTGKVHAEITLPSVLRSGIRVGPVLGGRPGETQLYLPLTAAGGAKCQRFAKAVSLELGGKRYRSDSWGCAPKPRAMYLSFPAAPPGRLARVLSAAAGVTVRPWADRGFFLPGRPKEFIGCEMHVYTPQPSGVQCFVVSPGEGTLVTMGESGTAKVCHGACVGNPEGYADLGYGHTLTLGPFRCSSQKVAVRCVVIESGRGFVLTLHTLQRLN